MKTKETKAFDKWWKHDKDNLGEEPTDKTKCKCFYLRGCHDTLDYAIKCKKKQRQIIYKELLDWISFKGFRECNYEMNEFIKHLWELKQNDSRRKNDNKRI